jgi:hypothetical protein
LTNTDPNAFWTSALLGNDVSSIKPNHTYEFVQCGVRSGK